MDWLPLALTIAGPLFLIAIGFVFGRQRRQAHLLSLAAREREFGEFLVFQEEVFSHPFPSSEPPRLVTGEFVLGSDRFMSFVSSLRNLFGGEMRSYQALVDRARREALVRLLADAKRAGFNAICNLRYSTVNISGFVKQLDVMIVVTASATGYRSVSE